jgi:hypothetical protein
MAKMAFSLEEALCGSTGLLHYHRLLSAGRFFVFNALEI